MTEFSPWDDDRPLHERLIVSRHEFQSDDVCLVAARENINVPVDWCFEEPHHTFVVHLNGVMDRMESVFKSGPSSAALPSVGDVWVIPAGYRYAALAQGNQVGFAEFRIPAGLLGGGEIAPRIGHRDQFLHHAASRAMALSARADDMGVMALEALLNALRYHFVDAYMGGSAGRSIEELRAMQLSRSQKALLIEYIRDRLHAHISMRDLSLLLGVSKTRFAEAFRASFGTTPWQYVVRVRITAARDLLERTDMSITNVALATGFSSSSHFAAAFNNHVGVSPRQYRTTKSGRSRVP